MIFVKEIVDNNQCQEVKEMQMKIHLSGMAVVAIMLMILAGGCASSSTSEPAETSHMKSDVGTSDELSPLAPSEINQYFRHLPGEDHF